MPIELPPTGRTRRQILAGGAAGLVGTLGGLSGCVSGIDAAQRPTTTRSFDNPRWHDRVMLLSDPHIAADPKTVSRDGVNMADRLRAVMSEISVMGRPKDWKPTSMASVELIYPHYDFMIVNGDNAYDTGELGDYQSLLYEPINLPGLADLLDASVHFTLGNHDHRANFRKIASAVMGTGSESSHHVRHLWEANGSRHADWLLLDSLRHTDEVPGVLGGQQLEWLARSAAVRPERPVIVVLHHPPVPDEDPDKPFSLIDHEDFWEVVDARPNIQTVFHGHSHLWNPRPRGWAMRMADGSQKKMRVPLIGLPPTSYVFEEGAPWGYVVADLDAGGMTLTLRAMEGHPKDGETVRIDWA